MSVVFVVIPMIPAVAAGWPAVAAAVSSACAALGYVIHQTSVVQVGKEQQASKTQSLELPITNAEVVGEALAREQSIKAEKGGVVATFSKDARGRLSLHVEGECSREELAAAGQELLNRVRQQYAVEKVKSELQSRGFVLVEEHVDENQSIRLAVRRFE